MKLKGLGDMVGGFACLLLAIVCSSSVVVVVTGKPVSSTMSTVSVRFHADGNNKLTTGPKGVGEAVAEAKFDNKINQTGWSYLQVSTSEGWEDHVQAYGAGVAEGQMTANLTQLQWANTMAGFCPQPYSPYCLKVQAFLSTNLHWMKKQITLHTAPTSHTGRGGQEPDIHFSYWHQVELFLYQVAGLADGLQGIERAPHTDIDPMGIYLFQVGGDLEDLSSVLGDRDLEEGPLGSGSCSALIKLLPGNRDLYVSHDTWDDYTSMLRVLKVYNFPWTMGNSKGKTAEGQKEDRIPGYLQSFSSYPGTLMSGDDFYLLSSGLAALETTIGNSNKSLWSFVHPQSVLEGLRSLVANRLATSGVEWAAIFSLFNSGTYNNEWMIVDYKRFQPGSPGPLPSGVLTVLDQIPGQVEFEDLSPLLTAQGYFPSYNVPYFPDVFQRSGCQANVDKYGPWFSYQNTARANIFRRDQAGVTDLPSMIKLMRYNNFQHDPLSRCNCTPPYSGENAVSSRSDLNPKNGTYPFAALGHRRHGGMDMKVTSWEMFRDLSFVAVGGPTWDQQPVFQWSTSPFHASPHAGQPDRWNFHPILFNASLIFHPPHA